LEDVENHQLKKESDEARDQKEGYFSVYSERSDFFLKERMKILQNYSHTSSVGSLVTNLHNREKLPETLEEVSKIVNGVNFYNDTMKMVEHGLLHVLMSFLEESLFLKETL
jgi:hypothetical protein